MSTATLTPELQHTNVMDRAVCLSITLRMVGNTRKVSTSKIEIDADKSLIAVSKTLLDSPQLKAVRSRDGEGRQWIYNHSLESPFQGGVYLIPNLLVKPVREYMERWREERADLIEKFIGAYPALRQEAESRLRDVFNPGDYPSVTTLRKQFSIDWHFVTFNTPDTLKEIDAELFEQEKKKAAALWADASASITSALREAMADLVNHLVDRLSGADDGKPKIFRNSLVTNVKDFLETFHARNITDDAALADLVNKANMLVDGVDAESLRNNEGTRDYVRNGFQQIKQSLDAMLQEKPRRAIDLDEE